MKRCALVAVLVLAAPAASAADSFYAIYIADRNGVAPCYARTYDAKHLAAHPDQKVVHFFLKHSEAEGMDPPKSFDLAFGFRLRDSTDSFSSEAGCAAKDDGAICAVEGDGGHFRLAPRGDGLLVTVVERLALEGMESFSPDLMESDDRAFLLHPSPADECLYDVLEGGDEPGGDPSAPALTRPG
ncbi:MAG TPA: hypothetical protein VFK86_00660 [Bauldia sp.]|nr:hypothetical protein [Bauldia sp.]